MGMLRGQRLSNDCGPTCFANVLNILGYNITIKKANTVCRLGKDGTDSFDLIKAFDRYGFEAKEKQNYSEKIAWNWLMNDSQRGTPIILSVDNDTHWLLVLRAGNNVAQIFDPDDSFPKQITQERLFERWGYFEDGETKPRFHGLRLAPYKNKSVNAVIMREMMLATIDVGEL